jgi:hypothetical protein
MISAVSIYIPRMSALWTESDIKNVMSFYSIGDVSNVDFTPINKKPGFAEDYESELMSAFVHFDEPYYSPDGKYNCKSGELLMEFWTTIAEEKAYKLQVNRDEYWICLKNKNPVKRTFMNIHQVVENGRHLESLVTAQAEEIKNLKETITELTEKLDGVHLALYQLLGGLYCQRTQPYALNEHLDIIGLGNDDRLIPIDDTHPSGIWPTTRQGDENSTKIEELEKRLQFLEKEL